MKLLLATGNPHKKEELSRILHPHIVLIPEDLGISFDAEETGTTYLENALIKARTLAGSVDGRMPVLADDSGLSVPVLGGAPGVYSARYGREESGRELEAAERNQLLLRNMKEFADEERAAFFVCCMALILDDFRIFTVQETFGGMIAEKPWGEGGFGYDPIFHLPQHGCTVAELSSGEKDRISHRGRAGLRIKAVMDSLEELR